MFSYKITPLIDQFHDPIYPVLVENVPQGSSMVSEIVLYEHDRMLGKFSFGKLENIISHWPKTAVNTLKQDIIKSIFK